MFSGIVETLGTVRAQTPGRIEIVPRTPFAHLEIGESIAVNGACLTVASVEGEAFVSDVMPETLRRTTLGTAHVGDRMNLEFDIIAKYVRNLVVPYRAGKPAD